MRDDVRPSLEVKDSPTEEDRKAILQALVAYNRAKGPPTKAEPVAILIRNENGDIDGGLWGHTIYDWLRVELVVVPESRRGHGLGRALLKEAENIARGRSCIGAWLDTFSFQARGFYEKLGYALCGSIKDHPVGGARHMLAKRFN